MLLLLIFSLVLLYISANICLLARKNCKAHQFFKIFAPDLPVVENPKLFSGHTFDITTQAKNWKLVDELHKKLGPSFGHFYCDQPWIATKDIELIKIVNIDGKSHNINKAFLGFPVDEFNKSIVEAKDADWRRARQVISASLTKTRVVNDEITEDFMICVKKLYHTVEKRLNRAELLTGRREYIMEDSHDIWERFSLAVVLLSAYKQEDLVDFDSEKDFWVAMIRASLDTAINPLLYASILFPFLRSLMTFCARFHPLGRMPRKLLKLLLSNISLNKRARKYHEKMQINLNGNDKAEDFSLVKNQGNFKRRLADSLIDSYYEKRINYTDLKSNLLILVLVGFETTANTGTLLTWLLARYPGVQEKLRKEIKLHGINSEYLQWCVLETVRYQSVVPFGGGRILTENIILDGKTYPKGAYILPSVYSIHHDPEIWPNPDEFRPERWSKKADFHPAAMLGFGVGARSCPGYQFAIHELKLATQMFLTNYRLETCNDTPEEYNFSSPGIFYSIFDDKIKLKVIPIEER